jgi:hypothetical protein
MIPGSLAALGPPVQLAFVARDLTPLVECWTKGVGAGPFFRIDNLLFKDSLYRGTRQDITIDVLLGYWRDLQIEFIRPHDDTPSVYSEWLQSGHTGLHHIATTVDDLAEARRAVEQSGFTVTQESLAYNGDPFYYVDIGGMYLEILAPDAGQRAFFELMRQAHLDWNGGDPVRMAPADEINRRRR